MPVTVPRAINQKFGSSESLVVIWIAPNFGPTPADASWTVSFSVAPAATDVGGAPPIRYPAGKRIFDKVNAAAPRF